MPWHPAYWAFDQTRTARFGKCAEELRRSDHLVTFWKVATISPSSPAIRVLNPYQTDDTDKPVPLPPAAMLFGSGLAFCFAVRRKLLRHDRLVSPTP